MMVAKLEIPPSQMMNIAKVLLLLYSSHYLDSLYTHVMIRTSQVLVYTCLCRND